MGRGVRVVCLLLQFQWTFPYFEFKCLTWSFIKLEGQAPPAIPVPPPPPPATCLGLLLVHNQIVDKISRRIIQLSWVPTQKLFVGSNILAHLSLKAQICFSCVRLSVRELFSIFDFSGTTWAFKPNLAHRRYSDLLK